MNTVGLVFLILILFLLVGAVGWVLFVRFRAQRLGLPPPTLSSFNPFASSDTSPYGPPRPAPGGIGGWFNDRLRLFKNRNARTAAGAYEQSSSNLEGGGRRGFGPLDPDAAWDARVGNEADAVYGPSGYYEEQELGVAPRHHQQQQQRGGLGAGLHHDDDEEDTSYGGGSYAMNLAATPTHPEHQRHRGGDDDDDEDAGGVVHDRGRPLSRNAGGLGAPGQGKNPFDDDADPSNISLRGVSPRPIETAQAQQQQQQQAAGGAGGGPAAGDSPTSRKSVFRENM